jgi:DnaK suppressor protein
MTQQEREQFHAKLTAMQNEIHGISDSAAHGLKPVMLDQTSDGLVSRIDAMQLQQMSQETARRRQSAPAQD